MRTTYIVEDSNKNIIEYTSTLYRAKQVLRRYGGYRIIKIRGPVFGEGYHKYELVWTGKRFQYGFRY